MENRVNIGESFLEANHVNQGIAILGKGGKLHGMRWIRDPWQISQRECTNAG